MPRTPASSSPPAGLLYLPDFLGAREHDELVRCVEALPFQEVRMLGVAARRTVVTYGWDYGYEAWTVTPAAPIPEILLPLRRRAAEAAGVDEARFTQAAVTRYPPGAGIGWHRDAPMFGAVVLGISLLSPCVMKLRRTVPAGRELHALELAPRSLYVLAGAARAGWQHGIRRVPALRYSITLRSVRERR